jgi:hypothetical protein
LTSSAAIGAGAAPNPCALPANDDCRDWVFSRRKPQNPR